MTRRAEGGVALVAWSVREGRWQRWVGPTFTRLTDLQESWIASQGLLGNEPGHLTLLDGAAEMQIYFHRGGAWTNAQSTGDLAPVGPGPRTPPPGAPGAGALPGVAIEALPAAVRLSIQLDGKALTRDIALGPSGG
jgi:general secretion pathway protein J